MIYLRILIHVEYILVYWASPGGLAWPGVTRAGLDFEYILDHFEYILVSPGPGREGHRAGLRASGGSGGRGRTASA